MGGKGIFVYEKKKIASLLFFFCFSPAFFPALRSQSRSRTIQKDIRKLKVLVQTSSPFLFFFKVADAMASIRDTIQLEGTPDTYRPLEV